MNKNTLLSMSQNYIIVPRDVPPENFKSVPEAIKVKRTPVRCVARNIIFILLIVCMSAGVISGVYLAFEETRSNNKHVEKYSEDEEKHVSDNHELLYRPVQTDDNETVFIKHSNPGPVHLDPCLSSPCQGGGQCESHDGTFSCYCPPGTWGPVCEGKIESGAEFRRSSRVRINSSQPVSPLSNLRFEFRLKEESGLVLMSGKLRILLENGTLKLEHGSHEFVYQKILLGTWHSVTISSYHQDLMLQLNKEKPLTVSLKERIFGRNYCFGSCDELRSGFVGCLRDLRIGHHPVSILSGLDSARDDIKQCSEPE